MHDAGAGEGGHAAKDDLLRPIIHRCRFLGIEPRHVAADMGQLLGMAQASFAFIGPFERILPFALAYGSTIALRPDHAEPPHSRLGMTVQPSHSTPHLNHRVG